MFCLPNIKRTTAFYGNTIFGYAGDGHSCGICEGYEWYDGQRWREELAKILKSIEK